MRSGAAEAMKQGLSFERGFLCPAGTEAFFICCLGRLRRGLGRRGHARRALQKKLSKACTLRVVFCALRARWLIFVLVWAACAAGGRRGPVRGCRPSEAPSALPPDDPAGLVVYLHSHGSAFKGLPYPTILRGLRGFRFGSFLAALGDLPARRAMPACAFALNERTGDVWLAEDVPKDSGLDMIFLLL